MTTGARRWRTGACRGQLAGLRARRGLAAPHLARVAELASAVGTSHEERTALAARGYALALRRPEPFDEAVLGAFAELSSTVPDPHGARGRLLLLAELEHRPGLPALLGLDEERAQELVALVRPEGSTWVSGGGCRGWGLVAGGPGLTESERLAGQDHLALCRQCRARLREVERVRTALLGGSAAVAAVVGAAQLGAGGASVAAAGGLLAGKTAVAVVGALGGAVLVAGGATTVLRVPPPHSSPVVQVPAGRTSAWDVSPSPVARCASECSSPAAVRTSPTATPSTPPASAPSSTGLLPSPSRLLPTDLLPLPSLPGLPTLPTALPSLPALPTALPEVADLLAPVVRSLSSAVPAVKP